MNPTPATPVYRAPMRSRRDDAPPHGALERALTLGLCGLGGTLHPHPATLTEAVTAASTQHNERLADRIQRFAAAPHGSYVWTLDSDGYHWLGRIAGEWRYDTSHPAHDVDLVHVRDCEWMPQPVPEEHVPPGVRASFARGGRNWQQIHAAGVSEATAAAWKTRVEQGNTIRR